MEKQELQKIIEDIITNAFIRVQNAYAHHREGYSSTPLKEGNPSTLLIYPKYFHGAPAPNSEFTRVSSEQEMRFAFIEAFKDYFENKEEKLYYSVETPTVERYGFSKGKLQRYESSSKQGRSGNFDLVVYDENLHRVCLLEFKNNYPGNEKVKAGERYREIQKDFLKLANPKENKVLDKNTGDKEDSLRYFVHIVTSYDKQKIEDRLKEADDVIDIVIGTDAIPVNYVLLSLCRDHTDDNEIISQDLPNIITQFKHIGFCDKPYSKLSYHKSLFVDHNYDKLREASGQHYLCEAIVESMQKQNISRIDIDMDKYKESNLYIDFAKNKGGNPWTHIEFIRINKEYEEKMFWRVDMRTQRYYIRLNQYATPKNEEIWYKMYRLNILRKAAHKILEDYHFPNLIADTPTNNGILESEIIIFFLDRNKLPQNNLVDIVDAIPIISKRMIEVFKNLPSKEEISLVRTLDKI